MRLCSVLLAVVSSSVAIASDVQAMWKGRPHKLKEEVILPRTWQKVGSAPPEHMIELRIGLKQSNFAELERQLYEIRYDL